MTDSTATPAAPADDTSANDERLPLRLEFGWGVGSLSMSAMFNAISLLLLAYLTDHVGLSAAIAGLLIGASKIYDAFTDPLMGVISDRTKSRWGRRRPYLLLGGAISAVSFILVFSVPVFESEAARIAFVLFALLLNATGYTVFNVPYLAMPAEMTQSYHGRTHLMSFRVIGVAAGQLLSSAAGPIIIAAYGGGWLGYSVMSWMVGICIFAVCALTFWMTRTASFTEQVTEHSYTLKDQLRLAVENRPFFILLGVKFTYLFGFAVFIAALPYLFIRILELPIGYLGTYYLFQSTAVMLSQPLWVIISKRIGKKGGYFLAAFLYAVTSASFALASAADPVWMTMARAACLGVAAGGLLLIGKVFLPDTIEYDYRRTGLRREGIFAGVYTTVEKVSFAFGPAVLGLLLGWFGYVESTGVRVEQTAEALRAVNIAMLFPAVTSALSCACLLAYPLTEDRLKREQKRAP